jgi:shikimate kinase
VGDRKSNVVLTGFMATGKSTVGRLLAVQRNASYIDTDEIIADRHGSIEEIFATQGEAAFREMERDIASELEKTSGLVIATGGRMMLDPDCAEALGSTGRVICLTASIEEIRRRLLIDEDESVRPLLAGSSEAELRLLYEERVAGYSRFQQIQTDRKSVEAVVEEIETLLGND